MRFADITGGLLGSVGHPFGMAGNVAENARKNPAAAFGLIGAMANDVNGGNYFGAVGNMTRMSGKPPEEQLGLPTFEDIFGTQNAGQSPKRDEFPGRRVGASTRIF